MHTRRFLKIIGVACLLASGGCQMDQFFSRSSSDKEGQLTSLENPEGVEVPDISIVDAREADLVEEVLRLRATYARTLKLLSDYYRSRGYAHKLAWTEQELADVARIKPFKYILDSEIPASSLRPVTVLSEADALFDRAREQMIKGGSEIPGIYRQEPMRKALVLFKELIEKYPTSDKIDDAAFYCGEIHKEYFKNEEPIAVRWYERAYTWDPQTTHPARFQAAVVYDYRLHDRDRALELYHDVVKKEAHNRSNIRFAIARINELTKASQPQLRPGGEVLTSVPSGDARVRPASATVAP